LFSLLLLFSSLISALIWALFENHKTLASNL
jgi:hypothetical protein